MTNWPFFKKKMHDKGDFGIVRPDRRIYAIGDIHGREDLLKLLLAAIQIDIETRPCVETIIIFLGDYIDRGPASNAVIERLSSVNLPGTKHYFLRGNHEQMLLEFLKSTNPNPSWLEFGGRETMLSYGAYATGRSSPEELTKTAETLHQLLPEGHRVFLGSLLDSVEIDGYYFVHAGLRPGIALAQQKASDLLWIRDLFLDHDQMFEKVVVHGHTPHEFPENLPNRINVDTGAYATHNLTAVVLERDIRSFITITSKNTQEEASQTF